MKTTTTPKTKTTVARTTKHFNTFSTITHKVSDTDGINRLGWAEIVEQVGHGIDGTPHYTDTMINVHVPTDAKARALVGQCSPDRGWVEVGRTTLFMSRAQMVALQAALAETLVA